MSRRTHYIPVGNLVLNGVTIDPEIYCPANGYPDPTAPETLAQYCPIGGYFDINQPIPYIPEPNLPTANPDEGQIILICTTDMNAAINVQTTTLSGQVNYSVYGANDVLIHSQNVNSGTVFFYQFPASGGTELGGGILGYKVVISAVTTELRTFKTLTKSGYDNFGWPILEAHIKCPTLTSLVDGFLNEGFIKLIKFYGPHDNLASLLQMASGTTNLKRLELPTSLNRLTSMNFLLQSSGCEECIIHATSLPELITMLGTFSGSKIKSNPLAHIPILPKCTTLTSAYSFAENLKGDLIIPECPLANNLSAVVSRTNISRLIFQGKMNGVFGNSISSIATFTPNLYEIVMPEEMLSVQDFIHTFADALSLKKLVLPKKIVLKGTLAAIPAMFIGTGISKQANNIEEMTTCEDWTIAPGRHWTGALPRALKRFDQPTLAIDRFEVNRSSSQVMSLEYIQFDYSALRTVDGSFVARYCNLSAAELNRISNLLPTVTSGTFNVQWNPGTATYDKTIAQAKGWTVT